MTIHIEQPLPSLSLATRVEAIRSPGGHAAWLLEDHTHPLVSIAFSFRGGSARDADGREGTGRLLGRLLKDGAGSLDGLAFHQALADHAVSLSFTIEHERLSGTLKTLTRNADRAFDLLGLALKEALLTEAAIERARAAVLADLRVRASQPDHVATLAFWARGFAGHPNARPVSGTPASIAAIGRDDIVAQYRETITRDGLDITVVGDIDAVTLGGALDRMFDSLPTGAPPPSPQTRLEGLGETITSRIEGPQSSIAFGRPGLPADDPDAMAAVVANHCFCGTTMTSRLFKELRVRRGLCYSVRSYLHTTQSASTVLGSTSTRNDRVADALGVIRAELDLLLREKIGPDELDRAKRHLIGAYALRFDSSTAIAALLLSLKAEKRDLSWLDQRNRSIAAVTPDDAARAIARVFSDGALLVSIAGDPQPAVH
ncbi:M16 family metallopeptidase [Rhizobium sp. Leaf341]|uniref:M16 family metallopeptidase n=1 Tax=Rhizobium sp. Leaf341 TaxID=1736344 RepID=UPI0007156B27|nr:pitrilysin family protein [Rhizobium sp. Leaf341]KQR69949.1 hypothetical protein ASG03_04620 [Rhizobium sp. Leaf341]